jgi:hypothetical protein
VPLAQLGIDLHFHRAAPVCAQPATGRPGSAVTPAIRPMDRIK